jgi:hypothetical protein
MNLFPAKSGNSDRQKHMMVPLGFKFNGAVFGVVIKPLPPTTPPISMPLPAVWFNHCGGRSPGHGVNVTTRALSDKSW